MNVLFGVKGVPIRNGAHGQVEFSGDSRKRVAVFYFVSDFSNDGLGGCFLRNNDFSSRSYDFAWTDTVGEHERIFIN